jgi:hypothetical protein
MRMRCNLAAALAGVVVPLGLGAAPIDSYLAVSFRDSLGVIADPASPSRGGVIQNIFSFFGGPASPQTVTDPTTGSRMGGTLWTDGRTEPLSNAHVRGNGSVAVTDTNAAAGHGVHGIMELRGRTQLLSGPTPTMEQGGASIVADLLVGLAPDGAFQAALEWQGPFAGTMPVLVLQDLGGPGGGTLQALYGGDGSYDRSLAPLLLGSQDGMDWYRYGINAPLLDTTPFNNADGCLGTFGPGWCVVDGTIADNSMRTVIGVDNGAVFDFTATSLEALGLPSAWLKVGGLPGRSGSRRPWPDRS